MSKRVNANKLSSGLQVPAAEPTSAATIGLTPYGCAADVTPEYRAK